MKNLGLIQALYSGLSAPDNTKLIWFDENVSKHKVYDVLTSTWMLLSDIKTSSFTFEKVSKASITNPASGYVCIFVATDDDILYRADHNEGGDTPIFTAIAGEGSGSIGLSQSNKGMMAKVTNPDNKKLCDTGFTKKPVENTSIYININGVPYLLGGTTSSFLYASSDGGAHAKNYFSTAAIEIGDLVYINNIGGTMFWTDTSDEIDFVYDVILGGLS